MLSLATGLPTTGAGPPVRAYHDLLPTEIHQAGKDQTQSIERKHLDLGTRIKRLARRIICFSKSVLMHDTVIGLLINHLFFKLNIHTWVTTIYSIK